MHTHRFSASLLRASASGFAAMAVSRMFERPGTASEDPTSGGLDAWQGHLQNLVLELAAAVEDGSREQFADRVGWARDAFAVRGLPTEGLRTGLAELGTVLEEVLPGEAWRPLPGFFDAARMELERTPEPDGTGDRGDGPLDEIAEAYIGRIREGDAAGAIGLVIDALRQNRLSFPEALDGVVSRAMREVGRLWHTDTVNVAEEHFATQTTGRLLEQIMLMAPKPSSNGRTVMLTMVEGDAHDLGLRIVAAFFELDGWRTICLGANTPPVDLSLSARTFDVDLIVLGATLNTQRGAVSRAIEVLRRSRPDQKVIVGGPAFSELEGRAKEIGANGCALAPEDAVRQGRELVEA